MNKIKFDENGGLVPQKINYKIKHDEETEELIENTIEKLIENTIEKLIENINGGQ